MSSDDRETKTRSHAHELTIEAPPEEEPPGEMPDLDRRRLVVDWYLDGKGGRTRAGRRCSRARRGPDPAGTAAPLRRC